MQEKTSASPVRRARLLPAAIGIAAGLAVVWAVAYFLSDSPYTILADGKPIATVASRRIAKSVLNEVRLRRSGGLGAATARFAVPVRLSRAAGKAELADPSEAVRAVEKAAPVEVQGFAIVVDDKPTVACTSQPNAEEALRLLKKHYLGKLQKPRSEPTFKEDVYIEKRFVDADAMCASARDAVTALTALTAEPVYHAVERGDRAAKLATQYGVSLTEMKRLNPGMDLDRLVEGERMLVRRGKRAVTVLYKAQVTQIVTVTPPPEARRYGRARTGKREIKMLVSYENGDPVRQDIISQVTTWDRPKGSTRRSYGSYRRTRPGRTTTQEQPAKPSAAPPSAPTPPVTPAPSAEPQ